MAHTIKFYQNNYNTSYVDIHFIIILFIAVIWIVSFIGVILLGVAVVTSIGLLIYLQQYKKKIQEIKKHQPSCGQVNYEHVKHDDAREFDDIDIHKNDAYGELELSFK